MHKKKTSIVASAYNNKHMSVSPHYISRIIPVDTIPAYQGTTKYIRVFTCHILWRKNISVISKCFSKNLISNITDISCTIQSIMYLIHSFFEVITLIIFLKKLIPPWTYTICYSFCSRTRIILIPTASIDI